MKDYLIEKMITLKARYAEVNRILAEEAADKEPSFIAKLSKELSVIEEPVSLFAQYEKNEEQLEEAKEMIKESDPELKLLGQEEFDRITAEQKDLYNRMQVSILPKDENDSMNIIVEIRGAVGGEEADLFAGDLYRMYLKYADAQHWKVQLIDDSPTTLGGYSSVSFMIKGKNVYSRLKFESGSHRVQRVPKTETNGRIHTSTATVLVMPETPAVDVVINPADLQIDTYRSQRRGGKGITGINTNVELYSARVLDENNSAPTSRVIEAIYWAIDHNVNIINMSFGMKEDSQALHNAIKDAYNAGILLIAAAGNTSQVEYPAAYEEVVAVGAVDSDGIVCDNSAKGDEIELVAPGEKIASTGGYEGILISSGTSMAAPHVTGLASLLWQKDMSMSSEFIRSLLKASANNYGDTKSYGYGLIDCKYADKIYASFKEKYSKNGTASNVEQYNNTAVVTTLAENTYVEGSWNTAEHQGFIGTPGKLTSANISEIKQGIVFPDKKGGIIQGVKKNPAFHGARNYVLNSIYLSYIARDGKIQEASKYFDSDIINANKNILDDMYNKLTQCGNSITGRYFLWGIALHNLTDTYAHQAYIRNPYNNQWYFLIHPDSDKVGCPGHLVGSDNPYIARGRFDSTQISATLGLTELLNGNAWTFRVYEHSGYFQSYYSREMDGFEYYHWEFKLKNLYKNAREVDFGAGYSNVLKQATYGSVK